MECGSVYEMKYVGPQDDGHGHGHDDHHPGKLERTCALDFMVASHRLTGAAVNLYPKPKDMADFLKPEYLHQ